MTACDVAILRTRHAHLQPVLDALGDALTAHGYRARSFDSTTAFVAQPELLTTTQVIAGFGDIPINAAVLAAATDLRGVVSCVSGTDGIDVAAASAHGVLVAHAPTFENARSMAEATLMLLLALRYDLDGTRENQRLGRGRGHTSRARMLHGSTIGLVGWGRIATHLAALLAPFGVRILVYSRRGTPPDLPGHAQSATLDHLLANADTVCIVAGVHPGAPPIVTGAHLARMQPHAFLVNVARGSAIDELALATALRERRIAGAALDVFAAEPLPATSPLRDCPNTILTPHHVGHTREADDSLVPAIIDNVFALLRGEPSPMLRNPEATDAWRARFGARTAAPHDLPGPDP